MNDMDSLTEITLSSEHVYEGGFLKIQRDKVSLPNGGNSQREFVLHPGAVVILAIDTDGLVIFERQYRHPLKRIFLELPAGKLDPEESPLEAAQRELLEETGRSAKCWERLGEIHPCIGYSDEVIHVYLALGVVQTASQQLDDNEFVEVFRLSTVEAIEKVWSGEITDAKTISVLFWLNNPLVQRSLLDVA